MKLIAVHGGDAADIEAFLADRIHEYNAAATGYHDAASFAAVQENRAGVSATTLCPALVRSGTRKRPIAPVAPAINTFMGGAQEPLYQL